MRVVDVSAENALKNKKLKPENSNRDVEKLSVKCLQKKVKGTKFEVRKSGGRWGVYSPKLEKKKKSY